MAMYYLRIVKNDLNNLPLRVVNGYEELFVVDDLIRLAGIDGITKQLLMTILSSRFEIDTLFRTRTLKLRPLEGYEVRCAKHLLIDKAGAYYILSRARVDSSGVGFGYEYNAYISDLANWFKTEFGIDEYDEYNVKLLGNSILSPKENDDYINFLW